MSDTESLLDLLRKRDEEIGRLRDVIDKLMTEFAAMYSDDVSERAYQRAHEKLLEVYYEAGFRSDGRSRG